MSRRPKRPTKSPETIPSPAAPVVAKKPGKLALLLPPFGELKSNWRAVAWSMASVVLLKLSLPPIGIWPLTFVALVPWLWGLRRTSPRLAFWVSWIFGFVHCLTLYGWLAVLSRFNPFIYLGIPAVALFQGFFYGVNGGGMVYFARRLGPWPAFGLAALWWAGWEWFRSVGALGNPFGLLGHGVGGFLPLVQVTALGGVVLLSALVLLINLSVMEVIAASRLRLVDKGVIGRAATALGLVLLGSIYGLLTMRSLDRRAEEESFELRVALLQTNVPQDEKYASYANPDQAAREELQNRMTRELFAMMEEIEPGSVDVIVTPESAFTQESFDLNQPLQRALMERVNNSNAVFITGANDNVFYNNNRELTEDPYEALDSLEPGAMLDYDSFGGFYVFTPRTEELVMKAQYRKIHLMPFGETVPYFDLIPGLQEKVVQIASFLKGDSHQAPIFIRADVTPDDPVDEDALIRIAPSICFEDLFAYLSNRQARRGAQLHINITNNAWFDPTAGAVYHFAFAKFRAAETRLPMLLCTNSGVTAAVDAAGRVTERLPRMERGTLVTTVRVPKEPGVTLYGRVGDLFGILSFLGAGAAYVLLLRGARRQTPMNTD